MSAKPAAIVLTAALSASAQPSGRVEYRVPEHGIEPAGSGVFRHDTRLIERGRVQLDPVAGVWLVVETASGEAARIVEPNSADAYDFRDYSEAGQGVARRLWSRLDFNNPARGVTAQLFAAPSLRIVFKVDAGVDLSAIRLRVETTAGDPVLLRRVPAVPAPTPLLSWTLPDGRTGLVYNPVASIGVDYQVLAGGSHFTVRPQGAVRYPDNPVTVEIPVGPDRSSQLQTLPAPLPGGGAFLASRSAFVRFHATGLPLSVTLLPRFVASRVATGPRGELAAFVVSQSAREPSLISLDAHGAFIGEVRAPEGNLQLLQVGNDSSVRALFSPGVILRWTPPSAHVDFLQNSPPDLYLTEGPNGQTVISYRDLASGGTQLGISWLDRRGDVIRRRTQPLADPAQVTRVSAHPLTFDFALNELWLAGSFNHVSGGVGNVLLRMSADGEKVTFAAATPVAVTDLAADGAGGVHMVGTTMQLSQWTPPDAFLRAGCLSFAASYYRRIDRNGRPLDATYLTTRTIATPRLTSFGGLDEFERLSGAVYAKTNLREHGRVVQCILHAASKLTLSSAVSGTVGRGQLITIVGQGFGPLDKVSLNGEPLEPVSADVGLITVRIPPQPSGPATSARLTIDPDDGKPPIPFLLTLIDAQFPGLFTSDNQGWGPAAAVNQDGRVNSPENPATAGSVVALYGTGFDHDDAASVTFELDGSGALQPEFIGPAPGLPAGITQINLRIPPGSRAGRLPLAVWRDWPPAQSDVSNRRVTVEVK